MAKLYDLLNDIKENDFLEDRREYDPPLLEEMYQLTEQEGEDLNFLIQREFEPNIRSVDFKNIPATTIAEYLVEGEHGGFDGFTEHEAIVIQKLMDDIKRYYIASIDLSTQYEEK